MRPTRTAASVSALLAVVALAGGCSKDEPALSPRPDLPSERAEALWNPCSVLEVKQVDRLFGTEFTADLGTDSEPRCAFSPATSGDPAFSVNYTLYEGTLRDFLGTLGDPGPTSTLSAPRLPDANGARILSSVDDDDEILAVTGFVRNGRLVQFVDLTDPAPFDKPALIRGVRELLTEFAEHADESGLSGNLADSGPTGSPTPATPSPSSRPTPPTPSPAR